MTEEPASQAIRQVSEIRTLPEATQKRITQLHQLADSITPLIVEEGRRQSPDWGSVEAMQASKSLLSMEIRHLSGGDTQAQTAALTHPRIGDWNDGVGAVLIDLTKTTDARERSEKISAFVKNYGPLAAEIDKQELMVRRDPLMRYINLGGAYLLEIRDQRESMEIEYDHLLHEMQLHPGDKSLGVRQSAVLKKMLPLDEQEEQVEATMSTMSRTLAHKYLNRDLPTFAHPRKADWMDAVKTLAESSPATLSPDEARAKFEDFVNQHGELAVAIDRYNNALAHPDNKQVIH